MKNPEKARFHMERDSRVEPPQLVPTQKRGISLKRIFLSSPLTFLYLRDRAGTKRGEQIAPTMLAVSATRKKSNMTVVSSQLNVGLQVLADRPGTSPPGRAPAVLSPAGYSLSGALRSLDAAQQDPRLAQPGKGV